MSVEAKDALTFWHSVELFSPPRIEEQDRRRGIVNVPVGSRLPWEPDHRLHVRPTKGKRWRHQVYLGIFPRQRIFEVLADALGVSLEDDDREKSASARGDTALLSFLLDEHGHAIRGSETVSSAAWD